MWYEVALSYPICNVQVGVIESVPVVVGGTKKPAKTFELFNNKVIFNRPGVAGAVL